MGLLLQDRVFIVWGGNRGLADKLCKKVESFGLPAHVGGAVDSAHQSYFLGARIIGQMDESSHAIILAEPQRVDGRWRFRENLMFEWGYLLGRMPPQNISVYLIGAPRESLPTDLQGSYVETVPEGLMRGYPRDADAPSPARLDTARSKYIARSFQQRLLQERLPSVVEIMSGWRRRWREFLRAQLDGGVAPRPQLLRRVLVNAFIPVAYHDADQDLLEEVFAQIDYGGAHGVAGVEDLILARSMAEFLRESRGEGASRCGAYNDIKRRFSSYANAEDPYAAMLIRYTMAQCLAAESMHPDHAPDMRRRLNQFASEHLSMALGLLDGVAPEGSGIRPMEIDADSDALWRGFLWGNLAKCRLAQGDVQGAVAAYDRCIAAREVAYRALAAGQDRSVAQVYDAETHVHQLRRMRCAERYDEETLAFVDNQVVHLRDLLAPHQLRILETELTRTMEARAEQTRLL